ncbi:MAG: hypothetical protein EOM25_05350 [Deltaproteobacteria bacterium]|nr:hypothetical protein [Deltaproteobacteria bacterium]
MCFDHLKFTYDLQNREDGNVNIRFLGVDCSDLATASFLHSVFITFMNDENFSNSREISWVNSENAALYFKPQHKGSILDGDLEVNLACQAKKEKAVTEQIELSYQQVAMLNIVLQKAISVM